MSNHVSQPCALRLKEAGWVKETHSYYRLHDIMNGELWISHCGVPEIKGDTWLPAPNVCEIGEELSKEDYTIYWAHVARDFNDVADDVDEFWFEFCKWLYSIMHNAKEVAKVWLWTHGRKRRTVLHMKAGTGGECHFDKPQFGVPWDETQDK